MKGFFITGTDTGVGKTIVTAALTSALNRSGQAAVGLKPVATGARKTKQGMRNEDAEFLIKENVIELPYEVVNPYCFKIPASPHIAAADENSRIEIPVIVETVEKAAAKADWVVVEGVGGWEVPLNDEESISDLAAALDLPVVIVVSIRLGCINHATLTVDSIRAKGLRIAGWVANLMDLKMDHVPAIINVLNHRANAPMLGIIPPFKTAVPQQIANHLNVKLLLQSCGYET